MSNTNTKFDYQQISSIYESMNNIIGDPSDPTTIAGLLKKIDDDYHEVVNGTAGEDYLAIYGDLGGTLLDSWENTAATFPAFIENFSAWSTVVAQAAGNYADFETQVKGIRSDNPLGWNTGGIQDSRVATSTYASAYSHDELDQHAALRQFYDTVGAYYVDTGMVSYAKTAGFLNGLTDVLSVVSIVTAPFSLGASGVFSGAGKAGAGLADDAIGAAAKAGAGLGDDALGAAAKTGAGLGDDLVGAAAGSGDDIANTAIQTRINDMVGIGKTPATKLGAPSSAATSAFSKMPAEAAASATTSKLSGLFSSAKTKVGSVTDDVLAKIFKVDGPTRDLLKMDGVSVKKYIFSGMGKNLGADAGTGIFNTAKTKLAGYSDDAIIKMFNISDDTLSSLAKHGLSVKDYAAYSIRETLSTTASSAGTWLKTTGSTAGTWIKNTGTAIGTGVKDIAGNATVTGVISATSGVGSEITGSINSGRTGSLMAYDQANVVTSDASTSIRGNTFEILNNTTNGDE